MPHSEFEEIVSSVSQGFIFNTPILVNTYICDSFLQTADLGVASDDDDNSSFTCSSELNKILSKLKIVVDKMFKWFKNNYFK